MRSWEKAFCSGSSAFRFRSSSCSGCSSTKEDAGFFRRAIGGSPMILNTVSSNKAFGGTQGVYWHRSAETGPDIPFSVFVPQQAEADAKLPVIWYLSGLTCTHANVTEKGEYRRA